VGIYKLFLTEAYQRQGKYAEAERLLNRIIDTQKTKGELQQMFLSIASLAEVYRLQGKNAEARANYATARDGLKKVLGEDHVSLGSCHKGLAQVLLAEKKYVEAEAEIRQALTFFKKTMVGYQYAQLELNSILGAILAGQKKYDVAEPLLRTAYEELKQLEKTVPEISRTIVPEALDRLIQFYTDTSKPDEVKKWQAEKDKLPKPVVKK
jgi:tetratricopeptide (TPR) repeat protein